MKKTYWIIIIIFIVIGLLVVFFYPKDCDKLRRECKCFGFERMTLANLCPGCGHKSICNGIPYGCHFIWPHFPSTNPENPIITDVNEIEVRDGKSSVRSAAVYNNNFTDEKVSLYITRCINATGGPERGISLLSQPQEIPLGEEKSYEFIISTSNTSVGIYVCTVSASTADNIEDAQSDPNAVSKEIFIKVIK